MGEEGSRDTWDAYDWELDDPNLLFGPGGHERECIVCGYWLGYHNKLEFVACTNALWQDRKLKRCICNELEDLHKPSIAAALSSLGAEYAERVSSVCVALFGEESAASKQRELVRRKS